MVQMVAQGEDQREGWYYAVNDYDAQANRRSMQKWLAEFVAKEDYLDVMERLAMKKIGQFFKHEFVSTANKVINFRKQTFSGVQIHSEDLEQTLKSGIHLVEFYQEWCEACKDTAKKYE